MAHCRICDQKLGFMNSCENELCINCAEKLYNALGSKSFYCNKCKLPCTINIDNESRISSNCCNTGVRDKKNRMM